MKKVPKEVLEGLMQGIGLMLNQYQDAAKTPQLLLEIVSLYAILDWAEKNLKRASLKPKTNAAQAAALLWFTATTDLFDTPYLAAHLLGNEQYLISKINKP